MASLVGCVESSSGELEDAIDGSAIAKVRNCISLSRSQGSAKLLSGIDAAFSAFGRGPDIEVA